MNNPKSTAARPVRVLLVDANEVLRRGLALMIAREPGLTVVGEASSHLEALEMVTRVDPDLAMVDLGLSSRDSLELVREMRRRRRGFPVLLLTRRDDDRLTERALRAGARGLMSKWATAHAVAAAVRKVLAGGICVAPAIGGFADRGTLGASPPISEPHLVQQVLAPREIEVLILLGRGNDHTEIAAELGLAVKTVEVYLSNARRKLGLPTFLALHCWAHNLYGREQGTHAGGEGPAR
jgi:DNA-binding NarL/FixJ family response regulator